MGVDATYDVNTKLTNCVLDAVLAPTEQLQFVLNGWFMQRRSDMHSL